MRKEGVIIFLVLAMVFSSMVFISANAFSDWWSNLFNKNVQLSPVNLISNGDFSNNLTGWKVSGSNVQVINPQYKTLSIQGRGWAYQPFKTSAGKTYSITLDAMGTGSPQAIYPFVIIRNSNTGKDFANYRIKSNDWTNTYGTGQFSYNFTIPDNSVYWLILGASENNSEYAFFDNVKIEELSSPDLITSAFCQSHAFYSSSTPVVNQGCCFNKAVVNSNTIMPQILGDNSTNNTYMCYNGQIFDRLNKGYYWTTYKPTCSVVGNYYASPTGRYGEWKTGNGQGIICGTGKTCDGDGACVSTISSGATCTDSDVNATYPDGKNIYIKGTATGRGIGSQLSDRNVTLSDFCLDSGRVYEQYCVPPDPLGYNYSYVYTSILSCPIGQSCSNGSCVSSSQPKIEIKLFITKDIYKIGEKIELR